MTFSNKNVIHPPVHFQDRMIDDIEQHKHLGLTISTKLNWKNHISNIISSISEILDKSYQKISIGQVWKLSTIHLLDLKWNMHVLFGMATQNRIVKYLRIVSYELLEL